MKSRPKYFNSFARPLYGCCWVWVWLVSFCSQAIHGFEWTQKVRHYWLASSRECSLLHDCLSYGSFLSKILFSIFFYFLPKKREIKSIKRSYLNIASISQCRGKHFVTWTLVLCSHLFRRDSMIILYYDSSRLCNVSIVPKAKGGRGHWIEIEFYCEKNNVFSSIFSMWKYFFFLYSTSTLRIFVDTLILIELQNFMCRFLFLGAMPLKKP